MPKETQQTHSQHAAPAPTEGDASCWASTSTEMKKKPCVIPRSWRMLGMSTANDTQSKLNKC